MRALSVVGTGGIDDLRLIEREVPRAGPGEVVVRVEAAGLNHRDLSMLHGRAAGTPDTPFTPMSDCAGVIDAVGDGVRGVAVGDRVTSLYFQEWLDGPITPEARWGLLPSARFDGVGAEYARLLAQGVHPVPSNLSAIEAATLPCAALTAWRAMFEEAALGPGATVLIQGTGGVATFALQFAVALGLRAVVTSSSDHKLAQASALGAEFVVNYRTTPDWAAETKRLVGRGGVDFVLGVGGAGNLAQSLDVVALGGEIAVIGMLGGAVEELSFRSLVAKNAVLRGVSVGSRAMFGRMVEAIEAHDIHPVVHSVYDLGAAPDAFTELERGAHMGKIVLTT